ncbi:CBS domain-containing protein [Candidatus Bathyarchaeota archaeon]|nr:CBS domain-containing protein [Candidatus Bathyarchaeota archaeon]
MSEPLIVVSPEERLEKAVGLMMAQKIKKLPVIEAETDSFRIIGMLSLIDVARLHPELVQGIKSLSESSEELDTSFYVT